MHGKAVSVEAALFFWQTLLELHGRMGCVNSSSGLYYSCPLSLAPMVDKTHRHWRRLIRCITRHTLMYTEMITPPALINGERKKVLYFDAVENPLVLQLGWDQAEPLAESCRIAADWGYREINLNCGCPSSKVQQHDFGACLMARPGHVAELVKAMSRASAVPVTVKTRIGIRSRARSLSLEEYQHLHNFVKIVADAGCRKFIIHARIAVLEGLSPRENRNIPPLRPEEVYRLKEDFPGLFIEINGGYKSAEAVDKALERVDAVMLGRAALDNPWMLSQADSRWFGSDSAPPARREVLEKMFPYMIEQEGRGVSRGLLIQPVMNLFAGCPGSRTWKRLLSETLTKSESDFADMLYLALAAMDPEILDETF